MLGVDTRLQPLGFYRRGIDLGGLDGMLTTYTLHPCPLSYSALC